MRIQRLHVNRTIPASSYDLGKPLGIILIGLVDLHLERGARMSCIETNNIETAPSKFMHQPRRHGTGLDANMRIITRMAADRRFNSIGFGGANATPEAVAIYINNTNCRRLLGNV